MLCLLQGAQYLFDHYISPFLKHHAAKLDPVFASTNTVSPPCIRRCQKTVIWQKNWPLCPPTSGCRRCAVLQGRPRLLMHFMFRLWRLPLRDWVVLQLFLLLLVSSVWEAYLHMLAGGSVLLRLQAVGDDGNTPQPSAARQHHSASMTTGCRCLGVTGLSACTALAHK